MYTVIAIIVGISPVLCLLMLWKVDTRLDVLEMWIKTIHEEVQKSHDEMVALGENTEETNEEE